MQTLWLASTCISCLSLSLSKHHAQLVHAHIQTHLWSFPQHPQNGEMMQRTVQAVRRRNQKKKKVSVAIDFDSVLFCTAEE